MLQFENIGAEYLFAEAVRAAVAGKKFIRHGGILYSVHYFVGTEFIGNHSPLPRGLCAALGLKPGSATFHQGAQRLKKLLQQK
jgi:hypothetical protein